MEFITNRTNNFSILPSQDNFDINNKLNVVSINGRLDISSAKYLEAEFSAKMSAHKDIIVDMSHCEYISNYGICFLSTIVNKAKLLNIKIVFTAIIDKISEIFELTGFSNAIELATTFEDAIKDYAFN